jgi:hypothetical protein
MNKIPGINISKLSNVNLGKYMGEMMDYESYVPYTSTETSSTGTTINIETVNGLSGKDIADSLTEELSGKVNLGL